MSRQGMPEPEEQFWKELQAELDAEQAEPMAEEEVDAIYSQVLAQITESSDAPESARPAADPATLAPAAVRDFQRRRLTAAAVLVMGVLAVAAGTFVATGGLRWAWNLGSTFFPEPTPQNPDGSPGGDLNFQKAVYQLFLDSPETQKLTLSFALIGDRVQRALDQLIQIRDAGGANAQSAADYLRSCRAIFDEGLALRGSVEPISDRFAGMIRELRDAVRAGQANSQQVRQVGNQLQLAFRALNGLFERESESRPPFDDPKVIKLMSVWREAIVPRWLQDRGL